MRRKCDIIKGVFRQKVRRKQGNQNLKAKFRIEHICTVLAPLRPWLG